MDSYFRKGFEDNGYVLLGWSEAGFVYLMSTLPISSVADLKKAKVWSWEESPMAKAIFDEAGVTAIPLSIPDVLVGLQTGLVDVVYAPPTGAISLQWFTKVKYLTDVPLVYLAGGVVMNRDTLNRFPATFQNILFESSQRHLDQLKTVTRNENQEAIKVMVKHGVKIVTPSKDQIDEFKRLSNRAMGRISGPSFSSKTLDEVISLLETNRRGENMDRWERIDEIVGHSGANPSRYPVELHDPHCLFPDRPPKFFFHRSRLGGCPGQESRFMDRFYRGYHCTREKENTYPSMWFRDGCRLWERMLSTLITHVFSFLICCLLTFAALKFIENEFQMGSVPFLGIPAWISEMILPITFGVMAFRFGLRFLKIF